MAVLSPALGTVIAGEGRVVFRDVTVHGLHRMCIETKGVYPDVETWMKLLEGREMKIIRTRYTEKQSEIAFFGYLWFFWKEG